MWLLAFLAACICISLASTTSITGCVNLSCAKGTIDDDGKTSPPQMETHFKFEKGSLCILVVEPQGAGKFKYTMSGITKPEDYWKTLENQDVKVEKRTCDHQAGAAGHWHCHCEGPTACNVEISEFIKIAQKKDSADPWSHHVSNVYYTGNYCFPWYGVIALCLAGVILLLVGCGAIIACLCRRRKRKAAIAVLTKSEGSGSSKL